METLYISTRNWRSFLKGRIEERRIYAPFDSRNVTCYGRVSNSNLEDIVYCRARPAEPLKMFLMPFRERSCPSLPEIPDIVVMGAAACDLAALRILDAVFLNGQYKDPNYHMRRNHTLIVSFDCLAPYPSCFCELVQIHPYAESGFDLNISLYGEGMLVDIGSDRGREFLGNDRGFLAAEEEALRNRRESRRQVSEYIIEKNRSHDLKQVSKLRETFHTEFWKVPKEVENCVQCGSCTNNCPTCVCFIIEDTGKEDVSVKQKVWDSCLFPGYARMAAGSSPRPTLYDRYANRLLCKYWYMPENFTFTGCTGCGRCISGCIGKIDKRAVLTEVLREKR